MTNDEQYLLQLSDYGIFVTNLSRKCMSLEELSELVRGVKMFTSHFSNNEELKEYVDRYFVEEEERIFDEVLKNYPHEPVSMKGQTRIYLLKRGKRCKIGYSDDVQGEVDRLDSISDPATLVAVSKELDGIKEPHIKAIASLSEFKAENGWYYFPPHIEASICNFIRGLGTVEAEV